MPQCQLHLRLVPRRGHITYILITDSTTRIKCATTTTLPSASDDSTVVKHIMCCRQIRHRLQIRDGVQGLKDCGAVEAARLGWTWGKRRATTT